jgi:hypothetical protein
MIRNMLTRGSAKAAMLLTGFFVLIAAAFFVLSSANTAFTLGSMQGGEKTLKGEIVAMDNGHHIRTLTLRSDEIGRYPNDKLNIFLNKDTKVKVCGMREPAKDINVSRNATIRYHELGGVAVANSVSERC